jgi:hypothetical protein
VTTTLFATDASATVHSGEVVLVELGDTEFALPPSTARAFVDDLAAAVETVTDEREADLADEESPPIPTEDQASPDDLLCDDPTPEPRERDPDAESVLRPAGEAIERVAAGEDDNEPVLEFEPGEEIDTHTANESQGNPYVYLGVDVVDALQERADTVADRVTVLEIAGVASLAPGPSEEWPDYSVGADSITIGKPGCRVLGIGPGDEIRTVAGEDVVRVETVDDADDTLDGAADWTPEGGTADDEDLVELASPDSGATRQCQNCGNEVSKRYVDVFAPDSADQPRCCPDCEDLVRDGNGVREKRSG